MALLVSRALLAQLEVAKAYNVTVAYVITLPNNILPISSLSFTPLIKFKDPDLKFLSILRERVLVVSSLSLSALQ